MLRKIRIVLGSVFFVAVTLLFLDFTGTLHTWLGWMAKVQFLPAVLALNTGVILALVLLTLVTGRLYCSVICPMGVFQDMISWLNGRRSKKNRYRFSYSPEKKWLRYGFLAAFIVALVAGAGSLAALIAPYSSYGRIASNLFAPVWQAGNNILAWISARAGNYAFYSTEVWIRSLPTFIIAAVTFIIIFIMAWKGGRTYCNTVCPVGTVLGFFSRFSLFRPVIDTNRCRNCSLCARGCKASCIDISSHRIDYSRCVACMDCISNCRDGAISYRFTGWKHSCAKQQDGKPDSKGQASRRTFIMTALTTAAAASVKAQEMKVDGGLAAIQDKKIPERKTPVKPAGALSLSNFSNHCTACQLCVSVCPNQVLRPSMSLQTLMQPEMSFERGYCRPECTKCSEVCPAGAITPVTREEKTAIQIGHAVVIHDNCVVLRDKVSCGNCERHCPSGAITMVPSEPGNPDSLKIPAVDTEKCIGCGACENLCPARPFSAIYVEGNRVHMNI